MINRTAKLLLSKRHECKRLATALQAAESQLRLIATDGVKLSFVAGYAGRAADIAADALATCGYKPVN